MVQRFWWGAASGAYVSHGEVLGATEHCNSSWSAGGGNLCGQAPERVAWFKAYMSNTTLHPSFDQCEGDDDGYVHTLTCLGGEFLLFHFYGLHGFSNASYQYLRLPTGFKMKQQLLQPWEMRVSTIWAPPDEEEGGEEADGEGRGHWRGGAPPPGARVWGPKRGAGWAPVGITVDEDTVPHIITFTKAGGGTTGAGSKKLKNVTKAKNAKGAGGWLDLPF